MLIKAGRLIDVRNGRVLNDQAILIEGDRIKEVGPSNQLASKAAGARVIDLSGATVLPGMIDCHTHILLQGDITNADYDEQLLKESIPYRTIRATVAARTGLMNGFTAMRDLETEGAMYADVDVKRAINAGVHRRAANVRLDAGLQRDGDVSADRLLVGAARAGRRADRRRRGQHSPSGSRAGQVRRRLDQVLLRPPLLS